MGLFFFYPCKSSEDPTQSSFDHVVGEGLGVGEVAEGEALQGGDGNEGGLAWRDAFTLWQLLKETDDEGHDLLVLSAKEGGEPLAKALVHKN